MTVFQALISCDIIGRVGGAAGNSNALLRLLREITWQLAMGWCVVRYSTHLLLSAQKKECDS